MKKYKSLIFDCDGVILNSNKIKTEAFRKTLQKYNLEAIDEFIKYHKENGGISRYIKLENFLKNILPKYDKNFRFNKSELKILLENYSYQCKIALFNAEVTKDLSKLRELSGNIPWLIVSGGDQIELREVFNKKGLAEYFNGGIFGSPDTKKDIIKREISNGIIQLPSLMLGDSKLDHIAAESNKLDFLFVYQWTDFTEYKKYCIINSINKIKTVSDTINFLN